VVERKLGGKEAGEQRGRESKEAGAERQRGAGEERRTKNEFVECAGTGELR
jgi:hypothetical protein